tara:strand:- start:4760 stop:5449 length:690 start_codon:yes stop_codon:yes gene_type:complete
MKALLTGLFFLINIGWAMAQQVEDSVALDNRYLEDQFYLGITYNFLLQQPTDISQRSLSYGLQAGFIKDIPLNGIRTKGIGVGLGYGVYSYYSNLLASESGSTVVFSAIDSNTDFIRNKVETHMLEIPFEFRWRNSTPAEYKFWRIYSGIKFSYLLGARSKYIDDLAHISFSNTEVNKLQYGLTLNFGYNTFNIHAYYALNNLFKDTAQVNGENIAMKPLRLGFIFYIL